MPASSRAEELEKALNLLVHDLRAPLSVAHGYLRLIREQRLPGEADRERALTQTAEALARISQLCEDASKFVAAPTAAETLTRRLAAAELADRLGEAVGDQVHVERRPLAPALGISVARPEALIEAVAVVVAAVERRCGADAAVTLRIHTFANELRLLVGPLAELDDLAAPDPAPFDPWTGGHGLRLPLACGTITRGAGRLWTTNGSRKAVGIALPLETSPQ